MMDFDKMALEIADAWIHPDCRDEATPLIAAALKAAYNDGVEVALKEAQPWFKPEAGNHPDIMIRSKMALA